MKVFNQIKSKRFNCNRAIFNILIQINTFSTLSITSTITFIYRTFYEFFANSSIYRISLRIRLHIETFYDYFTNSRISIRISTRNLFTYHSVKMTSSTFAIIFAFDFLSFSFVLCDHVEKNHSMTQNLKTLYNMHLIENAKTLRCN